MGLKGNVGIQGDPVPCMGPRGPRVGTMTKEGRASPCRLPVGMTTNESQTTILKCTADGNSSPKVTRSKLYSSLLVGCHVVKSSSALIVKDVSRFTYIEVVNSPTRPKSFLLHDLSLFVYIKIVSPTLKSKILRRLMNITAHRKQRSRI